ncbi:MAG: cupin domain-containing protein [Rikenellaceae bacterium]|nr:cupin domain-containing protein [Rikenellaceae bacterium]
MATVLKTGRRDFREAPGKIDNFRLRTDSSRNSAGVVPENLNFDLRRLDPGQYSSPYHFHRYAEELFMIISGEATLRSPEGVQTVGEGDIVFMEKGSGGAHQLYNHTDRPCVYLDVRSFVGYDVAEYPDSGKILLVPSFEIFDKNRQMTYFENEEDPSAKWEELDKVHNK